MYFLAYYHAQNRVFPFRLTTCSMGIFNNRLLFLTLFSGNFCRNEGNKAVL